MNNNLKKSPTVDTNDLFREYDGLVGLTMLNIYTLSKETNTIRLIDFNRKNKEHLYFLRVALIAQDLYDFPIEIEGSWWDIFCINWKIRKGFKKIKRIKSPATVGIFVPAVLNFMRQDGIQRLGETFTFADIYKQYYERSF